MIATILFVASVYTSIWDQIVTADTTDQLETRLNLKSEQEIRVRACAAEIRLNQVPLHCFGPDLTHAEKSRMTQICLRSASQALYLPLRSVSKMKSWVSKECMKQIEKRRADLFYARTSRAKNAPR